jgi:putative heme-binding domain-containing protein
MISTLLMLAVAATSSDGGAPQWIWGARDRQTGQSFCLRGSVTLRANLTRARLTAVADYCDAAFFVNDQEVARRGPHESPVQLDVLGRLNRGENKLFICCRSAEGPAAVMLRLDVEYEDGRRETFGADETWQAAILDSEYLSPPRGQDAVWRPVTSFGAVEIYPWGEQADTVTIRPTDNYEQWKQAIGAAAGSDPQTFQTLPGFEVQLVRSAAPDEDSWVSLACDEQGRWVIAKEKQGLLRVTLPSTDGGDVRVETINESLAECRGLLFAYGSLYAMANNDHALFRLRDTNGDDVFDEVKKLATFEGGVGHGRNQITLGPEGMIYGIFGDSVEEPASAKSLPPRLGRPTRQEEARSGFVARTDRDGRGWEIVVRGLRNPFGIDFNPHGDMFTYDADAEYDMGSPWYRPTRIDHLTPGGDFGWRSVTGQWPPYFPDRPDMPQPTFDIGKGSPTAVEFGTASHFPPNFRKALFALDWTYGRILAVHLAPRGSSYAAYAETFLRGRPLNVTDVEFGPDGAMYFVTGGRGTRSALYRVAYTGPEIGEALPGEQQLARERHAEAARETRRQLEALLGREGKTALETAWPHLGSSDPWIRHAARSVLETQPVASWRERALREIEPAASLAALLALARMGDSNQGAVILEGLNRMELSKLPERHKVESIFLYDRCLPDTVAAATREAALRRLDPLYPDSSFAVNQPLSLLLARLAAPELVSRTMKLLEQSEDQRERMHYLFVLRSASEGWTPDVRQRYFKHLARMSEFIGGEGMPTFRRLIETDALNSAPEADRANLSKLLLGNLLTTTFDLPQEDRPFVQKWTLDDFPDSLLDPHEPRDVERGQRMFAASRCIACHRAGGAGGVSGPDLTAISHRFSPRDILVSILEPSRVVAENYRSDTFELRDGRVVTGRIVPGDYRSPELTVMPDLLTPEKTITFSKSDIESHTPSPISPMPAGLADMLTREEILDLLAYLSNPASDN